MSQAIYNDAIMAMAKSVAGTGRIDNPDGSSTCDNPLCGDRVTVDLNLADGCISDIAQKTRGCILTKAAAAFVVEMAKEMPVGELAAYRDRLRGYLRGESDVPPDRRLAMFAPVRDVKSRHDCILIAFDALVAAGREASES